MRQNRMSFLVVLTILWASSAEAITGNEWKGLPESQRSGYVMGVVDAWHTVSLMVENTSGLKSISEQMILGNSDCLRKRHMPYRQVIAIVEKFMNDNPAEWDANMASCIWSAVAQACEIIKK